MEIALLLLGIVGVICFFAVVAGLFAFSGIVSTLWVGVPFVPTPKRNVSLVMNATRLKPGEVFYDLGCGDGRFIIAAAAAGARAEGFEVSPWAYCRARWNIWTHHSSAQVFFKNFYKTPIGAADVVFCFLVDTAMEKLRPKLEHELKKGAWVVSYGFPVIGWTADEIIETDIHNSKASKIYFYQR